MSEDISQWHGIWGYRENNGSTSHHGYRIYACYIHIDIKNAKIWIQHNMTEADLGQELVTRGVPHSDIVLGLHPPYKRPYTDYGVA